MFDIRFVNRMFTVTPVKTATRVVRGHEDTRFFVLVGCLSRCCQSINFTTFGLAGLLTPPPPPPPPRGGFILPPLLYDATGL